MTARNPYLARFPQFIPNPQASVKTEFKRLARLNGWKAGSAEYLRERHAYLSSEYELHIGGIERSGKLDQFQALCRELGVDNPPDSITKCKQILKTQVHVNLIDLVNSRRMGTKVRVFRRYAELVQYTRKTKKFFPLGEAKKDSLKRILLREIFRG